MNKKEAIEAMKVGKKVTHEYFNSDEYIYMIGESLYDEDDLNLDRNDFWSDRLTENWSNGWSVK
jgi:hypothetical protein